MQDTNLRIGGAVAFWKLAPRTNRDELKRGFANQGMDKLTPELRTPQSVLKEALGVVFADKTNLVRSCDGENYDFAIVEERKGDGQNEYSHLASAKAKNEYDIELTPYDRSDEVQTAYDERKNLLTPGMVSKALVEIVEKRLGGTPLRPAGGVYWIPQHSLFSWSLIGEAVESAAVGDKSCCYTMKVVADSDMVRAVQDAITTEITAEVSRIEAEVNTGTLGAAALSRRLTQLTPLRNKLKDYEQALGVFAETVHENLDRAEQAAANGVIMQAAAASNANNQDLAFAS